MQWGNMSKSMSMLNYTCEYHIFYNNEIIYRERVNRGRGAGGPTDLISSRWWGPYASHCPNQLYISHWQTGGSFPVPTPTPLFSFSSSYFRVDPNLPLHFYYYLILVPQTFILSQLLPYTTVQYGTVQCETLISHSA